jgi:WD40 repeat protein
MCHRERLTLFHKEERGPWKKRTIFSLHVSPDGRTLLTGAERENKVWDAVTGQELGTLEGERGTFSPDGKLLALATKDGTVTLWSRASRQVKAILQGHTGSVGSIAFAPDGKTLATGASDKTIRLWDVAKRRERACLRGHSRGVVSIAFSQDGRTLASGSGNQSGKGGEAKLWDVATGRERVTLGRELCYVMFAPGGKTLATFAGGRLKLWDVATGRKRSPLGADEWGTNDFAFALGGRMMAVGGSVWEIATEKRVIFPKRVAGRPATAESGPLNYRWPSFSPDGKTFVRVGDFGVKGGEVELWDTATWEKRASIKGVDTGYRHGYPVTPIAFSPDSKTLAVASLDSTIKITDTATGRLKASLMGHTEPVVSVTFGSDGKSLVTLSQDKTVKVWDANTDDGAITLKGHDGPVYVMAFTADGQTLASGGEDGTVRLWHVASGKRVATLRGHAGPVLSLAFTPDGKTLASGSGFLERKQTRERRSGKPLPPVEGEIVLWDLPTKRKDILFKKLQGSISCLAFHPSGEILAAGVNNENADGDLCGNLKVWDRGTGEEQVSIHCPHQLRPVRSLAFTPNGKAFAIADLAATRKGEVMLWDASTGEDRTRFRFPKDEMIGEANCVALSPDGETLAMEWADKRVRLWDARTGKARVSLQMLPFQFEPRKSFEPANSLAFASDGKTLATVSEDNLVKLWQAATGLELITLRGHAGKIYCVRFSPDGQTLATAGKDGIVKLWRAARKDEIGSQSK